MKSAFTVLFCFAVTACAQTNKLSEWTKLVDNPTHAKMARSLCESFVLSTVLSERVEAEKCLANVELVGAQSLRIEKGQVFSPASANLPSGTPRR